MKEGFVSQAERLVDTYSVSDDDDKHCLAIIEEEVAVPLEVPRSGSWEEKRERESLKV